MGCCVGVSAAVTVSTTDPACNPGSEGTLELDAGTSEGGYIWGCAASVTLAKGLWVPPHSVDRVAARTSPDDCVVEPAHGSKVGAQQAVVGGGTGTSEGSCSWGCAGAGTVGAEKTLGTDEDHAASVTLGEGLWVPPHSVDRVAARTSPDDCVVEPAQGLKVGAPQTVLGGGTEPVVCVEGVSCEAHRDDGRRGELLSEGCAYCVRANLDLGSFCEEVDNAAPLDRKVAQEPGGMCIGQEFQGVHLNFPTNSLRKRLRRAVRDAERAGVGLDCHGVNLGDSDQWFAQEAPSNCFEVLASPRSGCTDGMEGEYLANQDPMVRGEFAGDSVADEPTTHGGDGPGLGGLDGWVTVGSGLSEEKGYGHPREDVDRNGKGSGSAPRAARDPEATGSERQEGRGEESQPPVSITTNKTTLLASTNARETSGPSSHEGRGSNWDPGGAPRYQHRPPVFITAGEPTLLAPTSARTAFGPLPLEGRGCTWDPGGAPHHQNQNITVSETRRSETGSIADLGSRQYTQVTAPTANELNKVRETLASLPGLRSPTLSFQLSPETGRLPELGATAAVAETDRTKPGPSVGAERVGALRVPARAGAYAKGRTRTGQCCRTPQLAGPVLGPCEPPLAVAPPVPSVTKRAPCCSCGCMAVSQWAGRALLSVAPPPVVG